MEQCVRSTWLRRLDDKKWCKAGDREYINASEPMPEDCDHCVVLVHTENYIYPQGWMAQIEIDDDTPVVTATYFMRKSLLEGSQSAREADISMWKYTANVAIHSLLRGCRTLALPLFIGACLFKQVALDFGFPIADR